MLVALLVLFRPIAAISRSQLFVTIYIGGQDMCKNLMMMCSCDDQLIDEGDEAL